MVEKIIKNKKYMISILFLLLSSCNVLNSVEETQKEITSGYEITVTGDVIMGNSMPNNDGTETKEFISTKSIEGTSLEPISKLDLLNFLHSKSTFDEICQLPCIWGFDPITSQSNDVIGFINDFKETEVSGEYVINSDEYEDNKRLSLMVWEEDFITRIQFTYINNPSVKNLILSGMFSSNQGEMDGELLVPYDYYFSQYQLPEIFKEYGKPTDIFVGPRPDEPMLPWIPFNLILFYPENNFLVEYEFVKITNDDNFTACFDQLNSITLISWSENENESVDWVISEVDHLYWSMNLKTFENYYKSINEIMSLEMFFNDITVNHNNCINVPKEFWEYD
jgi:hypothetical protein